MTKPLDTEMALVVAAVLNKKVAEARAGLSKTGTEAWKVGERKIAELPDGTRVGSVTYTEGHEGGAYVSDEKAFKAWVLERYPTEIETVVRVRPAYQAKLLAGLKENQGSLDPKTGEIVEVPGVKFAKPTDPYLTVRTDENASELITAAVKSGALDYREVLQIGPGGSK